MEHLFWQSLPFVAPLLLPILALLATPWWRERARTITAALLALVALGLLADVAIFDHSHDLTLEVPSVFGRGAGSRLHVWVVDVVTAPVWHWHVVVAGYFGLAALVVFARRKRPAAPPEPETMAVSLFCYALAVRLLLEKAAAHVELVWALGTSATCLAIAPFFGLACGRRGYGFLRFAGALFLANLVQRILLVAVSWWATTRQLGTHLDVHRVTDVAPPGLGEITLTDAAQAWRDCILMPQLTFALGTTVVVSLLLGVVPWWLGRRRAPAT